jgi:hypothetical protein
MNPKTLRKISFIILALLLILFSFGIGILAYFGFDLLWDAVLVFSASLLASIIAFGSLYQKQKFLRELFKEFNHGYDCLNNELQRIYHGEFDCEEELELKNTLYDYFNLCGEEYFYFKQGYIPEDVWDTWCRGIYYYLQNPRILEVWNEEEPSDFYYGLTYEVIRTQVEKSNKTGPNKKTLK